MSGMYSKSKAKLWSGGINMLSTVTTVTAVGVSSSYVVDYASHEFLSSLTGTVTTPVTLTGVTTTGGKLTANSVTLSTPTTTCSAVVIYISTGVPATSPLICYLDDSDGLPSQPSDGQIPIDWDPNLGIISL